MDVDTYVHHLLYLNRKAYPSSDKLNQERFALDKFVETVWSSHLQFWLKPIILRIFKKLLIWQGRLTPQICGGVGGGATATTGLSPVADLQTALASFFFAVAEFDMVCCTESSTANTNS